MLVQEYRALIGQDADEIMVEVGPSGQTGGRGRESDGELRAFPTTAFWKGKQRQAQILPRQD
jgi:hypothetical protein